MFNYELLFKIIQQLLPNILDLLIIRNHPTIMSKKLGFSIFSKIMLGWAKLIHFKKKKNIYLCKYTVLVKKTGSSWRFWPGEGRARHSLPFFFCYNWPSKILLSLGPLSHLFSYVQEKKKLPRFFFVASDPRVHQRKKHKIKKSSLFPITFLDLQKETAFFWQSNFFCSQTGKIIKKR